MSKVIVLAEAPLRECDRVPVMTELDFPVNEDDANVYTGLRTPVDIGSSSEQSSVCSAQHHREDGSTSSLRHVTKGKEQCARVVFLLKSDMVGKVILGCLLARHGTIEQRGLPHCLNKQM